MVHHEPRRKGQGVIADLAGRLGRSEDITPRRRAALSFMFGMIGALALPPTSIFPVLFLAFPALIWLLRGAATSRQVFTSAWSFAFGFFLLGLYWIAAAMFVDLRAFWWGVPLAAAGLPAFFALYYATAMVAAYKIGLRGLGGIGVFALCWFAADFARGVALTGFPWNLEGYIWSNILPIMQSVSVGGIYSLTLITILAAALPLAVLERAARLRWASVAGIILLVVIAVWGGARMPAETAMTQTRLRVVQPNVAQTLKWNAGLQEQNFQHILDMTSRAAEHKPDIVVWPETASTFYLTEDEAHRRAVAASLLENEYLITGVIRRYLDDKEQLRYANAMVVVERSGRIAALYDKAHLVPFGEYIPFRKYVALRTLANLGVDFTAGQGLRTLHVDALPSFSPLICYESIFPGAVVAENDRPQFLVNMTNDGWYGKTAGPYQHFAISKTRAIEEGLPLVRSANTGISAVVDPYGRAVSKLDLGVSGYIDSDLPAPLAPTFYARHGEWVTAVLFLMMCVWVALLRQRRI